MSGTTLSKSVSLRIVANAGTAKETLDEIARKGDELNGKKSYLTVGVRTGDDMAKLDAIQAKARSMGIENIKIKINADSTNGLKTVRSEVSKTSTEVRKFSKGLQFAALGLTGFGDVSTATNRNASGFAKTMAALDFVTGLMEPTLAGILVSTVSIGSGLLAAGVGAGVFGLAVKGTITEIENANKANKKLGGELGKLQQTFNGAKTTWNNWISSSANGVASVLTPAIKLLPAALAIATKFLGPVEKALRGIVGNVKTAMDSPFWKSTISEWAKTSGPALSAIAKAIGNIIHGLVGVLNAFMPMSGSMLATVDKLTAKFAKWGETLDNGKHGGFDELIKMFHEEGPLAAKALENIAGSLLGVGKAMSGLTGVGNSKQLLQMIVTLSGWFNKLANSNPELVRTAIYILSVGDAMKRTSKAFDTAKDIAKPFKDAATHIKDFSNGLRGVENTSEAGAGAWEKIGSGIKKVTKSVKDFHAGSKIASAATKVWTGIQWAFDAAMAANPITLVIIAIVALIAIIVLCTIKFKGFRDFWKAAWKDIQNWTSNVISFLHDRWSSFINTFVRAGHTIESAWNSTVNFLRRVASSAINAVVSFFRGLPGKVGSALRNLGSMLLNVGRNAMLGLLHGIEGVAGRVIGYVSNIASKISGAFSKVLHMASPSRVFMEHGKNIGLGLMLGMAGAESGIIGSAARMGNAVSRGFNVQSPRSAGLGRQGGGNTFNITVTGVVGDAGATGKQIVQSINTYLRQTGQSYLAVA